MSEIQTPLQTPVQIPVQSKKTLLKASGIAAVIAAVVSVCFILPAEYNIDPTGIGGALGLTALSGVADKSAPAATIATAAPKDTVAPEPSEKIVYFTKDMSEYKKDVVIITVPARDGVEYKFDIKQGEKLEYSWQVKGAAMFYDFHGEQKGGNIGYYESFTIGTAKSVKGLFTAPFDGHHGWYWKNETKTDMHVELTTQGRNGIVGLIGG